MLSVLNVFLMVVVCLLLAERLNGLHVVVRSAVYAESPRGWALDVGVQPRGALA